MQGLCEARARESVGGRLQRKSAEIIALTAINRGPEGLTSGYYIVYRLPGK